MIHTDRIVKRSLDSPDHPLAATSAELLEAADTEAAATVVVPAAVAASVPHDNSTSRTFVPHHIVSDSYNLFVTLTHLQLPFSVGWQDLKDLFRQAGM
jgi:hypothetical protein